MQIGDNVILYGSNIVGKVYGFADKLDSVVVNVPHRGTCLMSVKLVEKTNMEVSE